MKKEQLIKRWLPAVVWCFFIFVLSSLPGADFSTESGTDFYIRKTLHVVEYSILCWTFYRGTKNILYSIVLSILVAVSDELHQNFVPTRTGKLSDVLIDSSAIMFAGVILWRFYQNLPAKLKTWLSE